MVGFYTNTLLNADDVRMHGNRFEAEFEYVVLSSVQAQLARPIVACYAVVAVFFGFE